MKTPVEILASQPGWLLVVLSLAFLVPVYEMSRFPLGGMIGYELAWTWKRAQASLESWKKDDKLQDARRQLYLDFLLVLFFYPLLSVACTIISTSSSDWSSFGVFLSWAILVAGLCDVVENIFLLKQIQEGASALSAGMAGFFSSVKWLIVISCGVYILRFGFLWPSAWLLVLYPIVRLFTFVRRLLNR